MAFYFYENLLERLADNMPIDIDIPAGIFWRLTNNYLAKDFGDVQYQAMTSVLLPYIRNKHSDSVLTKKKKEILSQAIANLSSPSVFTVCKSIDWLRRLSM